MALRDRIPCEWRDTPSSPPCGERAAHHRQVRVLTDAGWSWATLALCSRHYTRALRSPDGSAYTRDTRISEESLARARAIMEAGGTQQQAADAIGVSRASISRIAAKGWTMERFAPPEDVQRRLRRLKRQEPRDG